ncbi:hypothetical protein ACHAXN_009500 [Cyclotella atomus]
MLKRRQCYKLRIGRHILRRVGSRVRRVASIVEAMVAFVGWVLALERVVVVDNLGRGRDMVVQMPAVVVLRLYFRLVSLVVDGRSSSQVAVEGNIRKALVAVVAHRILFGEGGGGPYPSAPALPYPK